MTSAPLTSRSTWKTSQPPTTNSAPRASSSTPRPTVDDGPLAGWRWAYFKDPDGHTIELVEVAYVRQEERTADLTAYLKGRAATRRSSGEG